MAKNDTIVLTDNNRYSPNLFLGGQHDDVSVNTYSEKSSNLLVSKLNGLNGFHIKELCTQHSSLLAFPEDIKGSDDDPVIFDAYPIRDEAGKHTHYRFKTDNIMGFVGISDGKKSQYLKIRSRFAAGDNDYFLQYLLMKVFNFNFFKELDFTRDPKVMSFDMLMMMFPHYLKKAYAQGLFRAYKTFKHNDANVRGVIDAPRHLKKNIPFQGRIAYNTREYTRDNPLMQLVRHTIECIDRHKTGKEILKSDTETRGAIDVIRQYTLYNPNDRQYVISHNLKPAIHPFYTEYADLQNICLKILRHERIGYGNNKETVYGMLFDGAWLWEEYLNTILRNIGYEHPQNKKHIGGVQLFSEKSLKQHTLYPDFYNNNKKVVLDAKYKSFDSRLNSPTWDSSIREDIFQIITYMHIKGYKKGGFIFPDKIKQSIKKYPLVNDNETILSIPFNIPEEYDSWNKFCEQMQNEERNIKRDIDELCSNS